MASERFDVCVVGSANHDLIFDVARIPAPGETVLARDQSAGPGGKGLNQAVAATRAGAAVVFVGSVGSDDAGALLRTTLSSSGVVVAGLRTVSGPTGSAVVLRAEDGENAIVVSAGANGAAFELTDDVRSLLDTSAVLLCQQEVPAALNAAVIAYAATSGARVVLNAAPAIRLAPAVLEAVNVLIVNEHELAAQLSDDERSGDNDDEAVAGDLVAAVAARAATLTTERRSVVVTLGGAGAVCVESDQATHVPASAVDNVVDTTGAGDAFCGALCAALARGLSLTEAARFGAAAGALAVRGYGAAPSMAGADEIEAAVRTSAPPRRIDPS